MWRKTNQFEMIKGSAFVLLRMKSAKAIRKLWLIRLTQAVDSEGYTDKEASDKRSFVMLARETSAGFAPATLCVRTKREFFYFVDRIGDTFRWKARTSRPPKSQGDLRIFRSQARKRLRCSIPGTEGRGGMAASSPTMRWIYLRFGNI